jgi:hypothetical protein
VPHLRWVTLIVEARCHPLDQSEPSVGCAEQDRATVGAGVSLVELGYEGLVEQVWEQNALCCGMIVDAKAFVGANSFWAKVLCHT